MVARMRILTTCFFILTLIGTICIIYLSLNHVYLSETDHSEISIAVEEACQLSSPSTHETSSPFSSNMQTFRDLMAFRQAFVADYCDRKALSINSSVKWLHFYVQHEHMFLWCPVFKAASTTWLKYLVDLKAEKERARKEEERAKIKAKKWIKRLQQPNEIARHHYPQIRNYSEFVSVLHFSKFVIVRHPFTRLVAAYRDKFELMNPWFYQKDATKIIEGYRDLAMKRFNPEIIRATRDRKSKEPLPTFWEFVQYVLHKPNVTQLDAHWQPVSTFCSPCLMSYDYILKLESYEEEEEWLHQSLGIKELLRTQSLNRHKSTYATNEYITRKYFTQWLRMDDVEGLFKLYQNDFRMFGYTFEYGGKTFS